MKKNNHKFPLKLIPAFCIMVFIIIMSTIAITGLVFFSLIKLNIITYPKGYFFLVFIGILSIVLSTILAGMLGKKIFAPIKLLNSAMKDVACGNFTIRLEEAGHIEEVRAMASSFNIMTSELANMEIIHNDFTQNVSHELKTPLSAIEGYATLLQTKNLSEEKRQLYATKIIESSRRLTTLTGNILQLSRLEHQQIALERKPFFLDEQLRQVILLQEDKCNQMNLNLDINLINLTYVGSSDLLFHVWQNIFGNAIKFSSQGSTIGVSMTKNNEFITVAISDNGPGIPLHLQNRIFEKFYQGDKSHSAAGNGLGLSLAKQIVELHGGTITVTSEEGKGSTFFVNLPIV